MSRSPYMMRKLRPAFSLAEVVISILIVSILVTASLNTVGASAKGTKQISNASCGAFLAQELMSEITILPYQDPDGPTVLLGPEGAESQSTRNSLDDVDDFNGFSEGLIRNRDGSARPGLTGWSWSAVVSYVSSADLTTVSAVNTGYKRITVVVRNQSRTVATLTAIRTGAAVLWFFEPVPPDEDPIELPDPPQEI